MKAEKLIRLSLLSVAACVFAIRPSFSVLLPPGPVSPTFCPITSVTGVMKNVGHKAETIQVEVNKVKEKEKAVKAAAKTDYAGEFTGGLGVDNELGQIKGAREIVKSSSNSNSNSSSGAGQSSGEEQYSYDPDRDSLTPFVDAPQTDVMNPYTNAQAELDQLAKVAPVEELITSTLSIHNLLSSLPARKEAFDNYAHFVRLHQRSIDLLKESETCVKYYIGHYYENPTLPWSERDLGDKVNIHELRGGMSAWAISAFDVAMAGHVMNVTEKDIGLMEDKTDIDAEDSGAIDKMEVTPPNTDGLNNPDKPAEIEADNREVEIIKWKIGAEASKMLATDQHSSAPKWGTPKNKFPIWNDQKNFYDQYINLKYNQIKDYVINLDLRNEVFDIANKINNVNTLDHGIKVLGREDLKKFYQELDVVLKDHAAKEKSFMETAAQITALREKRKQAIADVINDYEAKREVLKREKQALVEATEKDVFALNRTIATTNILHEKKIDLNAQADDNISKVEETNEYYEGGDATEVVSKIEEIDRNKEFVVEEEDQEAAAEKVKSYSAVPAEPDSSAADTIVEEAPADKVSVTEILQQGTPADVDKVSVGTKEDTTFEPSDTEDGKKLLFDNSYIEDSAEDEIIDENEILENEVIEESETPEDELNLSSYKKTETISFAQSSIASEQSLVGQNITALRQTAVVQKKAVDSRKQRIKEINAELRKPDYAHVRKILGIEKEYNGRIEILEAQLIRERDALVKSRELVSSLYNLRLSSLTGIYSGIIANPNQQFSLQNTFSDSVLQSIGNSLTSAISKVNLAGSVDGLKQTIAASFGSMTKAAEDYYNPLITAALAEKDEALAESYRKALAFRVNEVDASNRYVSSVFTADKGIDTLKTDVLAKLISAKSTHSARYGSVSTDASQTYNIASEDPRHDSMLKYINDTYSISLNSVNSAQNEAQLKQNINNSFARMQTELEAYYNPLIEEAAASLEPELTNSYQEELKARLGDIEASKQYALSVFPTDAGEDIDFAELKKSVVASLIGSKSSNIIRHGKNKLAAINNIASLFGKSETIVNGIKDYAEQQIEKARADLFKLEENLYAVSSHQLVVDRHKELMQELQGLSIDKLISSISVLQALNPSAALSEVISKTYAAILLREACADNACEQADTEYFVGIIGKPGDLKAPKAPDEANLPPIREVLYFDDMNFAELKYSDEKEVVRESVINVSSNVPNIWKLILDRDVFVEKDLDLSYIFESSDKGAAEKFAFISGGIYPCQTGKYTVTVTEAYEYIVEVAEGESQYDYPACHNIKVEAANIPVVGTDKLYFTIYDIEGDVRGTGLSESINHGLVKRHNKNNKASELGALLEPERMSLRYFDIIGKQIKIPEKRLLLNSNISDVFARMDAVEAAVEAGEEYTPNLKDELFKRALFRNNQVGDFLKFVELERIMKQAKDELSVEINKSRQELIDALLAVGIEVPKNIDLSKQADYDLVKNKLIGAKNDKLNQASDDIEEIDVSDNPVAELRLGKAENTLQAMQKDNEGLLMLSREVSSGSEFDESLKAERANQEVQKEYKKRADEDMEKKINNLGSPYCAVY